MKSKSVEDQTRMEKLLAKLNHLSIKEKYTCFYLGCFTYLIFVGVLSKYRFYHSRKLEDLFAISIRKNLFRSIFKQRDI